LLRGQLLPQLRRLSRRLGQADQFRAALIHETRAE
jgi:hypothetical protein